MITPQQLKQLRDKFSHIFSIEKNGNMTLKDQFDIPPFKMIFVEGGEFVMGDKSLKNAAEHKVKLSSFFIAEHTVTQELYLALTGENPSHFQGANHPVEQASWYYAIEFCSMLNQKLKIKPGPYQIDKQNIDTNNKNKDDKIKWTVNFDQRLYGFRLPTEAEWEFAAKAAESVEANLYAGSNLLDDVGWYDENNYETKPVGLKFPNSRGIYDMSGNVSEFCWDWYSTLDINPAENPVGARIGSSRVARGGSWWGSAINCRTSSRIHPAPMWERNYYSFRVAFGFQVT